jgi:DASS family divalent anion:Na+ symporter
MSSRLGHLKQAAPFACGIALWIVPVPQGLTAPAWHLFAIFASAILSVLLGAFPLLTAAVIAVSAAVFTRTLAPAQAFSGWRRPS